MKQPETIRHTESPSHYDHLELKGVEQIIAEMNQEDAKVQQAIRPQLASIAKLIDVVVDRMLAGGRLFYIGAGTSGRLGILDASECPPTFGVPHGLVVGIIAGGDGAIRKAVEFAEDDVDQGWKDLKAHNISDRDIVIGLAASGTTPYVVGALKACQVQGIITGCITCNEYTPIAQVSDFPIEVIVGPEYVTGSTRLKSGTAQKMVLNMISTATMIRLGRVQGNRMVDMQLSNEKLVERGSQLVADGLNLSIKSARKLLLEKGSVRAALGTGSEGDKRK